ncbi:BAG_1a_G0048700.mRNA.1.CDS.1 [Saccharomyces cerevisiae]|nr:SX2_G0032790.mRNA.1.CDS.1 [Saccharomyces cerevisiae]CAI4748595.1 BAG_1a_G0048700.mRNA.1.CDS.1 [Saccharomyces cerevisiae]CAI7313107.1 BAG_1a_G0048700.mRNA.1.CDS.1 [Saccharomyces cerevisiae]
MNTQELCKIFVAREYPLVVVLFIYFVLFLHQKYHTTLNYVWYPTCTERICVREKGRKCTFFFSKVPRSDGFANNRCQRK